MHYASVTGHGKKQLAGREETLDDYNLAVVADPVLLAETIHKITPSIYHP